MQPSETLTPDLSFPVSIGRLWFQWRGWSPLPLFLLLFFLKPDFIPTTLGYLTFLLVILLAELLRIWSVGFAGSATRTRGDKVPELVHAGPYRFVRNPLYIANIAMYTACGLVFGFTALSAFIFFYSVVQYILIVSFEEELLTKTFGSHYSQYMNLVPRWFPTSQPFAPSEHLFSLKKALRSERSTLIAMLAMAILFLIK